jgi:hypothetical protein
MSSNNSKPTRSAPVIVLNDGGPSDLVRLIIRLVPAAFISVFLHIVILGIFFLFLGMRGEAAATEVVDNSQSVAADTPTEEKKDPFLSVDVDPAMQEVDTDIQYMADRKADVSVPGSVNPNEAVGILDGDKSAPPTNLPAPGGFGGKGQGGAIELSSGIGNSLAVGEIGGYGPKGLPLAGSFYGRSGATREYALREGGGTGESEAAVARGLKWIARQQDPGSGKWMLDSPKFKDRGTANDVAATAFGLLPLLGGGKAHKLLKGQKAADNPYDKVVLKGLNFLKSRQDPKKGDFGGGMYSHGLATIAICEAYGLTQDPNLRPYAQKAVNFIVQAQHVSNGGWRYAPNQEGDTSVTGWQVMALKSAQMAGLDVPDTSMKLAQRYLNNCMSETDYGYGYVGKGSSPTMSAVGLLCRQYLQGWGSQKLEMIQGVKNHVSNRNPTKDNLRQIGGCYYYYYATQVMHHYGGEAWKTWNKGMRDALVATQDTNEKTDNYGSWDSSGDPHGTSGGRLMITSLNLLTLEVYYRYLPLYYRDAGAKADPAVNR